VGHQREQVALRARGHEQRSGKTEVSGQAILEGVDGRIFTVNVITDGRAEHRLAHRVGGLGDGIAAEVDRAHGMGRSDGSSMLAEPGR
jgi:hypothetical protein